jgi:hypothetical protein
MLILGLDAVGRATAASGLYSTGAQAVPLHIAAWHRENEACNHLVAIPGIGMLTSTAMVAMVNDAWR